MPLCPGAMHIAGIRLTQKPYQEPLAAMPLSDLEAEGGLWSSLEEFISLFGADPELLVWVVRFELVTPTNLNVHKCSHYEHLTNIPRQKDIARIQFRQIDGSRHCLNPVPSI